MPEHHSRVHPGSSSIAPGSSQHSRRGHHRRCHRCYLCIIVPRRKPRIMFTLSFIASSEPAVDETPFCSIVPTPPPFRTRIIPLHSTFPPLIVSYEHVRILTLLTAPPSIVFVFTISFLLFRFFFFFCSFAVRGPRGWARDGGDDRAFSCMHLATPSLVYSSSNLINSALCCPGWPWVFRNIIPPCL